MSLYDRTDEPKEHDTSECPFFQGHHALSAILNAAEKGPIVVEVWMCPKCGISCWESHAFREIVSCGRCKHRVASSVPRYRNMLDSMPDLIDKGT